MEETTTSMLEGMIEEAERYATALRLLGVLPQIENLLEDMAYELRKAIQRKPVERFEDDPLSAFGLHLRGDEEWQK